MGFGNPDFVLNLKIWRFSRRRLIAILSVLVFVRAEQSCYECSECWQTRRRYLIHSDLLSNPHLNTPWQVLYSGQNDHAFITTMGIDVPTFYYILSHGFTTLWDITPISCNDISVTAHSCAYQCSLDAASALGLVLHWLNSIMQEVSLMQIFVLIPATISCYLHFSLTILLCTLKNIPKAYIQWPSGDQFQFLNELVVVCQPLLMGGLGTLDGLNLPVQTFQDQEIENTTYNGSVIAFSADSALLTNTPDRYYLVTNTAFPQGTDQIAGHIKAPLKQKLLLFDWKLLSFWQMADKQRHDLLKLCVQLNNVHVRMVGINQIQSIYMPIWQEDEEDRIVWAQFKDMLVSHQHSNNHIAQFHVLST
ncbi:hypothetical protein BDR04DRAFT_1127649 [Suillus decipiens]|nr:hypothetical protein BDR04DRAFT_1127649 [Suillus decipiens]